MQPPIRRCIRCQCPNCTDERNGKRVLPIGAKREHNCPFPDCDKVYGKTSHLKVFLIISFHLKINLRRTFVGIWESVRSAVLGLTVARASLDQTSCRDIFELIRARNDSNATFAVNVSCDQIISQSIAEHIRPRSHNCSLQVSSSIKFILFKAKIVVFSSVWFTMLTASINLYNWRSFDTFRHFCCANTAPRLKWLGI